MGFVSSLLGTQVDPNIVKDPSIQTPLTGEQLQASLVGAQSGVDQQQALVNAINAQGGLGNQSLVFQQQQALANQLGQQAQGQGPNPAQAALNQATGQNVQNQAALMASQRGANANAGLLARQAAQQGAGIQQQAAGQGAMMQAQQQLAAQQMLAQQQAAMGQMANTQVSNQMQGVQGLNQAAQGLSGQYMQGIQGQNQAQIGAANAVNQPRTQIATENARQAAAITGGILGGVAEAAPLFLNEGGQVQGPRSNAGQHLSWQGGNSAQQQQRAAQAQSGFMKAAQDNPVSKAIAWLSKSDGGMIGGKAQVAGDSIKNDTVPAMLSPGEIVIPREVVQSKDPVKGAAEFVRQVMAKKGLKK
jgi:hypothetical protein